MNENEKMELTDEQMLESIHFIRRIYFWQDTGKAIVFYHMSGDFQDRTVEQDWESFEELRAIADQKDQVDVLEWTLPDPAVEEMCSNAAWLGVRVNNGEYEVFDDSASIDDGTDGD
ncbi:hypothetical protein LJC33_00495 [Eubacteriales bacterium OttesenSCG-928-N13]|nr:hypothetical protein [Eubacteriales bacterium OttesenSCG-928-N13]